MDRLEVKHELGVKSATIHLDGHYVGMMTGVAYVLPRADKYDLYNIDDELVAIIYRCEVN